MITPLELDGLLLIEPKRHGDLRGFFSETYKQDELAQAGFRKTFVQDNHSRSGARGTVRGLHFQRPPHGQDKLIRVTRGAILDVAVDIRAGSATYGRHVAVELSEANWRQLLVPIGFAHGFMTLSDDCEVLYKVTAPYAPDAEGGLAFDDPALGIKWPVTRAEATLNARDAAWPPLAELGALFAAPFAAAGETGA